MKTLRIAVIQKLIKTSEALVKQAARSSDTEVKDKTLQAASYNEFKANCIAIKYGLTDYMSAAKETYHE